MPETIGLVILGAIDAAGVTGAATAATFTIGATGVSVATVVGGAALIGGTIGLQAALAPGKQTPKPQDGQQTVRQAIPVRRRSYGQVKIGGALLFSEVRAGQRVQLLATNHGEIAEILEHWLDDQPAVVGDGGYVVNLYGQKHVVLGWTLGTDAQPADSGLIFIFPDLWTAAHRARGIATVRVQLIQPAAKDYTKIFPGAQLPVYRQVVNSALVWDPRDPAQNKDDKSTWAFSDNSVLIALDFHRHLDGMGLAYLDDVLFTATAINEDWIPAANICNEAIPLKAGSIESRWRCAGNYPLNTAPKDVLSAILATCDGQTYQRADGAIGIRVGKIIAPTVTLADADILSYDGMRRGPSDSLVPVNQITAKYTSPQHDFQETDAQAWRNENAISAAGREENRDQPLQWVPAHGQTRRLMKLGLARANPDWSGRIVTSLAGLKAYNERYVHLVIDELMINGAFEIGSFTINPADMTCAVAVSSIDDDVFQWDADLEEGTSPPVPGQNTGDVILSPQNLTTGVAGGVITAQWSFSGRADTDTIAQYSVHAADNWIDMTLGVAGPQGQPLSATTPALSAGHYDVRVYFMVGTREGDVAGAPNINVT